MSARCGVLCCGVVCGECSLRDGVLFTWPAKKKQMGGRGGGQPCAAPCHAACLCCTSRWLTTCPLKLSLACVHLLVPSARADNSEWRAQFYKSVYDATNAEVHPARTISDEAKELAFYKWMARQKLYSKDLLKVPGCCAQQGLKGRSTPAPTHLAPPC